MKTIIEITIGAILVIVILLAVFFIIYQSFILIDRSITMTEELECRKWEEYKNNIPGWYSVNWQREQCKQFNIEL